MMESEGCSVSVFSDRLRALRQEKDEKQADLANLLGVSVQSYSAYEASREPSYDALCVLARHFGVTTDYLVGYSDFRTPERADVGAVTGLSDHAIARTEQFCTMGYMGIVNMILVSTDFISAISQIDELRKFKYDPSDYYAVLNKADHDTVSAGGEGKEAIIPGSHLNRVFVTGAKEAITNAIISVAKEVISSYSKE